MSSIIVQAVAGVIFILCLICTVATLRKVRGTKDKITTIVPILGVVVTLIPYVRPVGGDNGVAMYYGDLEAFKEIQKNYTKLVDKNNELNSMVKEQELTISNLKTQIQEGGQGEPGEMNSSNAGEGIDFQNVSDILYSGVEYEKFDGTTNDSFTVGGNDYRIGFTMWNDGSLFSTEDSGYVLFNLEGKYRTMVCNVGKMNSGTDNEVLYITSSDGAVDMQFEVRSDAASQELEIPLNYVKDIKIALDTGASVKYGFFGIKFYE